MYLFVEKMKEPISWKNKIIKKRKSDKKLFSKPIK